MSAKKKNAKPSGKAKQKKPTPVGSPSIDDVHKNETQTCSDRVQDDCNLKLQLERQQQLNSEMQAAGTAPSDDVINATESLYSSARVLLHLIERQYLSPTNSNASTVGAEKRFCSFAAWIVQELCSLSRSGRYDPLDAAWHGGRLIAETIHDVALKGPAEELQRIARTALYMPSLRVNTKVFNHDFADVAKLIQLSKDHTIRVDPQAEYQLDRAATRFVVEMIERFTFLRKTLEEKKEELIQFKKMPQATPDLKGATKLITFKSIELNLDNWLSWDYPEKMVSELLLCENVKPLCGETAGEWLEKFLTPFIGSYQNLQELIGFPFYKELEEGASKSTKPYGIRNELIKRCRQVLQAKTFFPKTVSAPPGISPPT